MKVSLVVSRVRSVPEWPVMATVTVSVGSVASFTVKPALPPSVISSAVGESTRPGVSLSVTATTTLAVRS